MAPPKIKQIELGQSFAKLIYLHLKNVEYIFTVPGHIIFEI